MNIAQFYAEDDRRQRSPEIELGVEWRVQSDPGALYALRWIEQTQEVYVMRQPVSDPAPMVLDARLGPFPRPLTNADLDVELLGWARNEEALRNALSGWEAHLREPNSLGWVQRQLAKAAAESSWAHDGRSEPSGW